MIYLIRHGKTPANEAHLYCGSTDLDLSEGGMAALRGIRYDISADRYITSGMKRTEQTLALLFGPVPFTREPELREVDFGVFEMKSYQQLKDDPDYQRWLTGDNEKNTPPGGESGDDMTRRVLRAYARIAALPGDTVIVTHGGVIAAILTALFPREGKSRYQWQPQPGGGYAVWPGGYRVLEAKEK